MAKKPSREVSSRKSTKRASVKTKPAKSARAESSKPRLKAKKKPSVEPLDLAGFPSESVTERTICLCLACTLDVLTRHMGLSIDRARSEIRRHSPTLEELARPALSRPYM